MSCVTERLERQKRQRSVLETSGRWENLLQWASPVSFHWKRILFNLEINFGMLLQHLKCPVKQSWGFDSALVHVWFSQTPTEFCEKKWVIICHKNSCGVHAPQIEICSVWAKLHSPVTSEALWSSEGISGNIDHVASHTRAWNSEKDSEDLNLEGSKRELTVTFCLVQQMCVQGGIPVLSPACGGSCRYPRGLWDGMQGAGWHCPAGALMCALISTGKFAWAPFSQECPSGQCLMVLTWPSAASPVTAEGRALRHHFLLKCHFPAFPHFPFLGAM